MLSKPRYELITVSEILRYKRQILFCIFLRDADAHNLRINAERNPDLRGDYMITFLDDGEGMEPSKNFSII
jgi:hypothetical protein